MMINSTNILHIAIQRIKFMPLSKSASRKAFRENVAAEIHAGKPVKQAAAIAFSVQRQAKKKKKRK